MNKKTINEKIAEVMGFRCVDSPFGNKYYDENENYIGEFSPEYNIIHAKLLQQRMVDDGWWIEIHHWKEQFKDFPAKIYFSVSGMKNELYRYADADTEPAALVELFCKVFNISTEE